MKEIYSLYDKPKSPLNYMAVRISLASPEKIRSWSHGWRSCSKPTSRLHRLSARQ